MSRRVAFWTVAATTITILFGSAVPSPLYPVYQHIWGFSALTLTVIFAAYVAALLVTLLTVGSLSDHIGRRPMLTASSAILIAAMIVFMTADGVGALMLARVLQGLATGAVMGTLSATLIDLQPVRNLGSTLGSLTPATGLALGAFVAGTLVEHAPNPRVTVYVVAAVALAAVWLATAFIPESSPRVGFRSRRDFWRTITPNVSVPRDARTAFLIGVPTMLATWALAGLYLSLGSSVVATILHIGDHAAVGAMLAVFFAAGAVGSGLASVVSATAKLRLGYTSLSIGVLVTLIGTMSASVVTYVIGSVLAGVGFGAAFVAVLASLAEATAATERGKVFSAVFVVSYSAFSLPAIVAGVTTEAYGLRTTAIGYSAVVLAVTIVAAVLALGRERRIAHAAAGSTAASETPVAETRA